MKRSEIPWTIGGTFKMSFIVSGVLFIGFFVGYWVFPNRDCPECPEPIVMIDTVGTPTFTLTDGPYEHPDDPTMLIKYIKTYKKGVIWELQREDVRMRYANGAYAYPRTVVAVDSKIIAIDSVCYRKEECP